MAITPPDGSTSPAFLDWEDLEDRGAILFDPTTKSSIGKPVVFVSEDVCGQEAYKTGTFSASINDLIECTPVLAATVSISYRIPNQEVTANYVQSAFLILRQQIREALDDVATPA